MTSPFVTLSRAVERFRADEADAQRATWRGEPWRAPALAVRADEAVDLLRETVSLRLAPPGELGALAAHLGRAAAEQELAGVRALLGRLRASTAVSGGEKVPLPVLVARALEGADRAHREAALSALAGVASQLTGELAEARARADEAAATWLALAPPRPDAPPETLLETAAAFLDATDGPFGELAARLGTPRALADLRGLAALPDGLFRESTRYRRLGEPLVPLGLLRDLSTSVRVEPSGALDPRPRLAVRAPRDVRVGAPAAAGGQLELAAADAVGRALVLSLASPGLPVVLARPLDATVSRAVGTWLSALHAEPRVLAARFGLSSRDAHGLARSAAYLVVLAARVDVAAPVARAALAAGAREAPVELLTRAAGLPVPAGLAGLVVRTPAALAARARGRLAGLALQVALREHFDEDLEKNPRTAEPLRAAAERGGGLASEAWLAELGCADVGASAARRVEELVR